VVHEVAIICLIHTEEIFLSQHKPLWRNLTADNMSIWYSETMAPLSVIFKATLS